MTKRQLYVIIDSILGDAIKAIENRRHDILTIAGEVADQAPEPGYNDDDAEMIQDLLRLRDGEDLQRWLGDYYDFFDPLLKEDYEEDEEDEEESPVYPCDLDAFGECSRDCKDCANCKPCN